MKSPVESKRDNCSPSIPRLNLLTGLMGKRTINGMVPLYQQISRSIEARIRCGDLRPGMKLPTESALQADHGVSRGTAARALNELAHSGLAVRRRRLGTFVADPAPQLDLLAFAVPGSAAKGGLPGRHEVLSARTTSAGDAVVRMPGVSEGVAVVELVRLKRDLQGHPASIERHVLRRAAAPDLLDQDLQSLVSMH
ncbi:hypothetical protein DMH18_30835 [Streptomyces sp. WAC 06783]|nr:hypothetical protein DMH18_30835 [Streptomyces sp. WAC 06783]